MINFTDKTELIIGKEKLMTIKNRLVLVIGIGGVGGTCLEGLVRSGFEHITIVDCDFVDITNLNRQILFLYDDVGKLKTDVAVSRMKSINPKIEIKAINAHIGDIKLDSLITEKIDFIVDAIDYIPGKLDIYRYAIERNIPFISSLGMGNRIEPEKIILTTLNKTENDPLARKLRYESKNLGLDLKKIPVVFSKENPLVKMPKPASIITTPSTAGLIMVKYILNTIK